MKYISVEQFLQVDKKVQDSIIEWWQPEVGDLVCDTKYQPERVLALAMDGDYEDYIVPLLTTQQLIDYIEWRTGYGIEKIDYGVCDCYWVYPYFESDYSIDQEAPRWYYKEMSFCNEELIQALWKCACEVATDEYYN